MLKNYYQFASKNHHFLLFGLITAFFGNYGQTFFIAWFGDSFLQAFNLSNAEYGLIYSSATLISGFIILYVGALLDKTPLTLFTLFTSVGLAMACFILYGATSVWHLVIALFLLRFCGQGLMFHIAFTSMARYFHQNRGKAIGIVGFGMPLGEAILPALAVTLIGLLGWRETWAILGLFLLIVFLPSMYYLLNQSKQRLSSMDKSAEQKSEGSLDTSWTRQQVIKDKRFWILIPVIMAPAFIVTGIFIHQSVLLTTKNWSEAWFAICFTVYAFSHLKASLVIGSLVDKHSGKTLIQFYLFPMFLGLAFLLLPFNTEFIAVAFMFLIGLTIGASGPVVGSLWVEIYGNQHIGAIRSMVTSLMVVSTAISPVLFGWLFDNNFTYNQVVIYLLIYLFVAWSLMKMIVLSPADKK